jgi:hypothetical protein
MQPLNDGGGSLRGGRGRAASSWVAIGLAILLLLSMTGLESLLYGMTGGGFLLP